MTDSASPSKQVWIFSTKKEKKAFISRQASILSRSRKANNLDKDAAAISQAAAVLGHGGGILGGPGRSRAMSPEERTASARKAADARWGAFHAKRRLMRVLRTIADSEGPCLTDSDLYLRDVRKAEADGLVESVEVQARQGRGWVLTAAGKERLGKLNG